MEKLFEVTFLEEAFEFLNKLERKHYEKILYNIRKSQIEHNPELFKKLTDEIWESALYIKDCNIDFSPFGINLLLKTPW